MFSFAFFHVSFFNYSRAKSCVINCDFCGHSVVTKCMNWIHPEQGVLLRMCHFDDVFLV